MSIEIETPSLNVTVHQASSLTASCPLLQPPAAGSMRLQILAPVPLAGIKVGVSGLFETRLRLRSEFNFQQKKKRQIGLEILFWTCI